MGPGGEHMRYFLGVDGGGTKTLLALCNEDGFVLDAVKVGPTNHEVCPDDFEGTRRELKNGLGALLSRNGLAVGQVENAALGLSGCDSIHQRQILLDMTRDMGLANFALNNDAFLGIKAGTPAGWGICSINGTGSIAAGVDIQGRMLQAGGLGVFSGEEAGGNHLGRMVFKRVYDQAYRLGEKTALTERMFDLMGLSGPEDLAVFWLERLVRPDAPEADALCRLLFEVAGEGDAVACELLRETGKTLARNAAGVMRCLSWPEAPVPTVLIGSVYIRPKCTLLLDTFKTELPRLARHEVEIRPLTAPPVVGALLWALEAAYPQGTPEFVRQRLMQEVKKL